MKIKIITGHDRKFQKKVDEILKIYNETSMCGGETFDCNYPDKAAVVYVKGVKGGIIVETIYRGGSFIYFAGFEEGQRRKGHLTACMSAYDARTPHNIIGVQLNPFDNFDLWQSKGFSQDNQIFLNGALTLLNITPDELGENMKKNPNNEQF